VILALLLVATHTLWPHLAWRWQLIGAAGYASHLVCDMLTPAGIALLWPSQRHIHLGGWVVTGGWAEEALFLPAFSAALLWAFLRAVHPGVGG